MGDNRRYAQLQPFALAGSGVSSGATSVIIQVFQDIDGNDLDMTAFGTKGFMTMEPGSSDKEEQISFTGITQNANGTATLTGVKNVAFLYPYTETVGLSKSHAGGTTLVVSNTSGFYNGLTNKDDTETITQEWTFPSAEADRPKLDADVDAVGLATLIDFGQLARSMASGAVNASEVVNGIVQLATNAQMGTATSVGSTGARLLPPNDELKKTSAGAADENKIPVLGSTGALDHGFIDATGTWSTVQSFTANNCQITTDADTANDAVRYSLLTSTVAAAASTGTSGEAFSVGQALYVKASDGKLYKAQGTADEKTFSFVGISLSAPGGADVAVTYAAVGGVATGLAGLTPGDWYFITDTAGTIGTTPGSRFAKIGQAQTTTTLRVIQPEFIVNGNTTITATGNTVITLGFYPAHIDIRAGMNGTGAQTAGLSVGDDTNTCVEMWTTTGNASYDAAKAWHVRDSLNAGSDGTVTSKTQTGFTFNCATFVGGSPDTHLLWTAYSL